MNILKCISTVLLYLSFLSCTDTLSSDYTFPKTVYLHSEELATDGVYMRYPFRIRQTDSCLYIMDLHASEYYCHQFSYPEMNHITSYGKKGEAPGELLDAENIRFDSEGNLWILDANKKKIVCLTSLAGTNSMVNMQDIPLSNDLVRALDFCFYNDSLLIIPDYTGKSRFCFIDRQGAIVKWLGNIPLREETDLAPMALAQIWRSFIHYNPSNGVLAMVTQLGEVLEIYDLKNDTSFVVYGPGKEPQYKYRSGLAVPSGIMGYSDVHVGEQYIYALFWGQSFEDIRKRDEDIQGGKYIHVFDFQGNPVVRYELDRLITGFHIDEERSLLLGLDVNSDRPVVGFEIKTKR